MAVARVEPLTTARALRGPFDYRIPPRLEGVEVGSVLRVPFGRQRLLGVVVEMAEGSELPPERLAEPIEALELGVPPELVGIGLWIASEYCSTPARGLGLTLPPGTGRAGGRARPLVELHAEATAEGHAALGNGARLGTRQRAALAALAAGERTSGELSRAGADGASLRRLEARGLVRLRGVERRRAPAVVEVGAGGERPALTATQRRAGEAIVAALEGRGDRELLLHGVTGSGKTEVYLKAAEATLERGRGAIVLVPEIALTPQAMTRFRARFGGAVALLHSRLGLGERYDEWRRLRSGEARVCVGPRSAVFAPVRNLGLVVIDEEHDPSYKQDQDPRYDARDVARRRAAEARAALVAGTATPRPESWLELPRVELPERIDGRAMPHVEILDMRTSARDVLRGGGALDGRRGGGAPMSARRGVAPGSGPLHPQTREALAAVARQGGKAIVLLNRRGWSPHLACQACGHAFGCPQCDVSLVVHRAAAELRCHHCDHREPFPGACPECESVTLARHGSGTERIESVLAEAAPSLPVFRLDSDSAAGVRAHGEILSRFEAAPAGVLVGTQMVAKGHDFSEVTLSVVLDADAALRFPDFRAEERTFALVAQLAGRSGRGERPGRVLIQTLAPEAPAIRHAAAHDALGFLAGELERRRALRYPPFSHLLAVELTSHDQARVATAAKQLATQLEPSLPDGAELFGPAPRFRLRGRHRRRLLVKAIERSPAVSAVREAVEAASRGRALQGVALAVDVDPH